MSLGHSFHGDGKDNVYPFGSLQFFGWMPVCRLCMVKYLDWEPFSPRSQHEHWWSTLGTNYQKSLPGREPSRGSTTCHPQRKPGPVTLEEDRGTKESGTTDTHTETQGRSGPIEDESAEVLREGLRTGSDRLAGTRHRGPGS